MNTVDTIAAICTGIGGAVSIIRISGEDSLSIANKVWKGRKKLDASCVRELVLGLACTDENLPGDPALAVFMKGPASYTGDDVVEIHCHGGLLSTRKTLDSIIKAGARLAEPGEFTYRAFVNGKMDLTQAEAVADLITAHSEMAMHLAERQMAGRLRDKVNSIREKVLDILSECESRMDFPEEDLDWSGPDQFVEAVENIEAEMLKLLYSRTEGAILREGIRVVIAGRPNVGKSSLMNLLLGFDRAIVTQIPGTTRDTLEEFAHIRNIPVRLIDTAGIREADDIIEGIGIERSRESMKQAQIIFWLMDASADDTQEECKELLEHTAGHKNIIAVWNKKDIAGDKKLPEIQVPSVEVSVAENTGITEFLNIFEKTVWGFPHTEEPEIAVSSRHANLLESAVEALPGAAENLKSEDWELAAVHLRSALASLGTVTGEEADPDILDNIFSRFCIGK